MGQEERSEALIGVLEDLQESDIGFVLVGGYAVSQFETRFSTDLDLVIAPDDYDEVVTFLEEHDFERDEELGVPPDETVYNREIELFERSEGLVHPVGVDVFVNGLGCRQTKAEWSFEYLREHSTEQTISGGSRRYSNDHSAFVCRQPRPFTRTSTPTGWTSPSLRSNNSISRL